MEGRANRCAPHGLAVGPDGRCVLCRQESAAPAQEPAVDVAALRNPLVWVAIAASLVAVAGVAKVTYSGILARGDRASAPVVNVVAPTSSSLIEPDPATPPAREGDHPSAISVATPSMLTPPPSQELEAPLDRRPTATTPSGSIERAAPQKAPPTEEELRAALRRVSITMYSTDWCPSCKNARAWFRANSISVDDRNVEQSESAHRAQLALNPKGSIPTIDVDGEVMVGFGPEHMEAMLRRAAQRRAQKF